MDETRRQTIERLLREGPRRLEELAGILDTTPSSVAGDLEYVIRSLRGGGRLVVQPATCCACGFTFEDRKRLTTPSRCPRCRSERIEDPTFRIEER